MKITKIKKDASTFSFTVTFSPNRIERLLGYKEHKKQYRPSTSHYKLRPNVEKYYKRDGRLLGAYSKIVTTIERFRKSW